MAIARKARQGKVAKSRAKAETVGGYKVIGRTRDGVKILQPKSRPKSFTVETLKKAIASACAGEAG